MEFLITTIFYFFIILIKYFAVIGLVFWYIQKKGKRHARYKLQQKQFKSADIKKEITWSISSIAIISIYTGLMFSVFKPYSKIYFDLGNPLWLLPSYVIAILIHDTYVYWAHRAMHHPLLFKSFHKLHHRFTNPSPWATYAFHPLEAMLQGGVIPIILLVLPINYYVFLLFVITEFLYNLNGHIAFEFFPSKLLFNKYGRWLNTSTNHNIHHQFFRGNYGLYFRWWDEWMNTTNKRYDKKLQQLFEPES